MARSWQSCRSKQKKMRDSRQSGNAISGKLSPFGRLAGGDNLPDMSSKHEEIDDFVKKNFDNKKIKSIYGSYQ